MDEAIIRGRPDLLLVSFTLGDDRAWARARDGLRDIPDAWYDPGQRLWEIPRARHPRVRAWAREHFPPTAVRDFTGWASGPQGAGQDQGRGPGAGHAPGPRDDYRRHDNTPPRGDAGHGRAGYRDPRDTRDTRGGQDARDARDARPPRGPGAGARDTRDTRDTRAPKGPQAAPGAGPAWAYLTLGLRPGAPDAEVHIAYRAARAAHLQAGSSDAALGTLEAALVAIADAR